MADAMDRNAQATLHERDDTGSDMQYSFRVVKSGPLAELVHEVARMPAAERARMVVDVPGGNTLNVGEILDLAARFDLSQ